MFVKVIGFGGITGISIPPRLRTPPTNTSSLVLTLVRWLSPHRTAVLRDAKLRPICVAPFDINHALWTFATLGARRASCHGRRFASQLGLFPGSDDAMRRTHAQTHERAMYDFIAPETIDEYVNCTYVDNDPNTLLETITLPFSV